MWTSQWVTLRNIVRLFASTGALESAAVLYGAVLAAATTAGPIYGQDKTKLDVIHANLQAQLGKRRLAELTEQGRALAPEGAADYTLELLAHLSAN